MSKKKCQALEHLIEILRQTEQKRAAEFADAQIAFNHAMRAAQLAAEEVTKAGDKLAGLNATTWLGSSSTAAAMTNWSAFRSHLSAALQQKIKAAEKTTQECSTAQRKRKKVQRAFAQTVAKKVAAERLLEKTCREEKRKAADKADEEALNQAAARRFGKDRT